LEEKIRTSSTKEVAGMFRGTTEAKASHSHNNHQTNKFSTLSSKRIASKDSRCRRQPQAKHHKSSTKARNTIKGRTGTKTKNQDSEGNIVSFTEKTKGTPPEIA
jgi:hypothetical protein